MRWTVTVSSLVLAAAFSTNASAASNGAPAKPLVIDAAGQSVDDVIQDLLLDADRNQWRLIEIRDVSFQRFGFDGKPIAFHECNAWFEAPETVTLWPTPKMTQLDISFWFQPASSARETRKWALQLTGQASTRPVRLTAITGTFVRHKIPFGPTTNLFLVRSIVLDGKTYSGSTPARIGQ